MSRAKAAPGAAVPKAVAASLAALLSPARAEASRTNGAKSKGPKTAEGKVRSAQNALKHGLRAQKCIVLPSEDAAAFEALEAALIEELAPEGALQSVLAQRVIAAAWRLQRADRIEAEIFTREMKGPFGDGDLGLALIRDCNGARSFDTLMRYRGGTLAEFSRALRTLKALQAEAAARKPTREVRGPEPASLPGQADVATIGETTAAPVPPAAREKPIEPEARGIPGRIASASRPGRGEPLVGEVAAQLTPATVTTLPDGSAWRSAPSSPGEGSAFKPRCAP